MKKSEKSKGNVLNIVLAAALIIITVYFLFKDNAGKQVLTLNFSENRHFVVAIFITMACYISLEGLAEYLILKNLGCKVNLFTSVLIAFVGYYFSMITPSSTGGQPMQAYYYSRKGIEVSKSSLALSSFILLYQIMVVLYVLFMLIVQSQFLYPAVQAVRYTLFYGLTMTIGLILLILSTLVSKKAVTTVIMKAISILSSWKIIKNKEKAIENAERSIDDYVRGFRHLMANPKTLLQVTGIIAVQLSLYFMIPYFALRALNVSAYSMFQIMGLQCLLYISIFAIPLPGSIGASETVFYIIYGLFLREELILPAIVLSRGASFLTFLILSGIITMLLQFFLKKKPSDTIEGS